MSIHAGKNYTCKQEEKASFGNDKEQDFPLAERLNCTDSRWVFSARYNSQLRKACVELGPMT